jgi:hypothetical protein
MRVCTLQAVLGIVLTTGAVVQIIRSDVVVLCCATNMSTWPWELRQMISPYVELNLLIERTNNNLI